MQGFEQRRVLETQSIAEDGVTDYDDDCMGCEAMIGELYSGFNYFPTTTHAKPSGQWPCRSRTRRSS